MLPFISRVISRRFVASSQNFDPSNLEKYDHLKPSDSEMKRVLCIFWSEDIYSLADSRKLDEDPVTDLFLKVIESIRLEQDAVIGQTVKVSEEHRKAAVENHKYKNRSRFDLPDQFTLEPPSEYTFQPWMFGRQDSETPKWLKSLIDLVDSGKPIPVPNFMVKPDTSHFQTQDGEALPGPIPAPFVETAELKDLKVRFEKEKGGNAKFLSKIEEMSLISPPEVPDYLKAEQPAAEE